MRMRVDEVGRPSEVLLHNVLGGERNLDTVRLHGSDVTKFLNLTAETLGVDDTDKVIVVTCEPIEGEIDAVVNETGLKTEVQFLLLLVSQICVRKVRDVKHGFLHGSERSPRIL